jgi:hypothetical protein
VPGAIEAWLELPPSVAFINGQMHWKGNLLEGQTSQFNTTIAFVTEGISSLSAFARFPKPTAVYGMMIQDDATWLRVTESGGELEAAKRADEPSYPAISHLPLDGSALLNTENSPQVFIVYDKSGLDELQKLNLTPDEPWGPWHGKVYGFTGVSDLEFENKGVLIALYDRQRPTTGYHFAVLRQQGGTIAKQMLGEETSESWPVILDIVATAPKAGWPVESRPSSPYELHLVPYRDYSPDGSMDVVLRVNGEVINRFTVVPGQSSSHLVKLTLTAFTEKVLQ